MTLRRRCSISLCALAVPALLLALAASTERSALAQDDADDEVTGYEALIKEGEALFKNEQWKDARSKFEKAYSLHPRPILLFNIASTYRREGRKDDALSYYNKYLEVAPPEAPYRGVAREAVLNIEEQLAAESNASKPPLVDTPETSSPGRLLRYSGIGLGLVGVASLTFGIYQGFEARELNDFLENLPAETEWTPELDGKYTRGESLEQQAIIFSVVGGVAIAAGGALYVAGMLSDGSSQERRPVAIAPLVGSDGLSGIAVSGGF